MKWDTKTKQEKLNEKVSSQCRWHKWWAWYPVTIDDGGSHRRVWLESVGRKKRITGHTDEMGYYITYFNVIGYKSIESAMMLRFSGDELADETKGRYLEKYTAYSPVSHRGSSPPSFKPPFPKGQQPPKKPPPPAPPKVK